MSVESITLQLPEGVVRQARQAARASRRRVEDVLAEWVRPPGQSTPDQEMPEDLSQCSDEALLHLARTAIEPAKARRLEVLLDVQGERPLTDAELTEAMRLVEDEDRLTLRRALAAYVLRQRGIEHNETTILPVP